MTTRCLSFHRTYGCQDRGACCTSQWPIPVESDRLIPMRAALAAGALRTAAHTTRDAFVAIDPGENATAEAAALIAITPGGCVFYRRRGDARCEIHRAMGHAALPLACRQFPRVVVRDPRGVSVTLSHYCPTAAALLDSGVPVAIALDGPAFPPSGEYVGLDAATALPPLLRPDMLMDWDAWWEFERLSVNWIADASPTCRDAVDGLATIVEDLRSWHPHEGALIDRVRRAFEVAAGGGPTLAPPGLPTADDGAARFRDIAAGIPDAWIARAPRLEWPCPGADAVAQSQDARVRRFVAAHAFASWTAQLGQGLRTWWRSIDAALLLIESGLDVRMADLVLRHLADPDALASVWGRSERA